MMIGWPEGELQLLLVSGAELSWEDVDTGIRTRGRDKGFWFWNGEGMETGDIWNWFWYVEDTDVGTGSGDLSV